MQEKPLDSFFERVLKKENASDATVEKVTNKLDKAKDALIFKPETPENSEEAYLLSATYDGEKRCAVLKLYDPKNEKIIFWYDKTGHKPYCLSNLTPEELSKIPHLMSHQGFDHFEVIEKQDPLNDKMIHVTKIIAHDPLSIGGRPSGSIRDILLQARSQYPNLQVWEADIKYYENFVYDRHLELGMPYKIVEGNLTPIEYEITPKLLQEMQEIFKNEPQEFLEYIKRWVRLLECPIPQLKYAALDIEVESPALNKVPNPQEAFYPIICASIVASDETKRVLILKRPNITDASLTLDENVKVDFYDREEELIIDLLRILLEYPVVVTFNGDEFDLRYIWHRAQRLGFTNQQIPIEMGRESALLSYGIHIDLYKFFFNRSIQVYAFDQKYRETNLQDISMAILGLGKLELKKGVSELNYDELAAYCLRDSELTYKLASQDSCLVLKLIMTISKISKLPLEDVARQGVSNWIRSMIYNEHRSKNILIPTSEELIKYKGGTTTEATIKGKKYKGAIVVEPKPGVNFNVAVLDFASLYPSIIKRWNLSYETILCPHPTCKTNLIPETPHWVCRVNRGLSSLLIGSLRDLRVKRYKIKSKDKQLPLEIRSWYSVIQKTLKVLLNASYGVFGASHFSLYCPPVAEATAAIGRYLINSTIKKAQELGIDVLYGDTDSIFLNNPSEMQIQELVKWSEAYLGMELDVDKIYRYSVFSTRKKNYVGVYPDGSVDIKGLTGKKRNTPEFLKDAFNDMINILSSVKTEKDFHQAKISIRDIVKECYTKLKNKQYSLEELAFTVVLGKGLDEYEKTTPQHVKALKFLSEDERSKISAGSLIRYVKIRKDPGVKLVELAEVDEIDIEKYVDHIQTTFEQVLDALDIDFNDIIGVSKLTFFIEKN
jgi:DNA polymerase I